MNPERLRLVMTIFDEVCDLPPDERSRAVESLCGDDPEVLRRVELMIEQDEGLTGPIGVAAHGAGADLLSVEIAREMDEQDQIPETMGPYRIINRLGEGGMGVVFEAEQENPRRRVALKVIRHGLGSRELIARFTREAQVLAHLQHPGIAHIYESGTASLGGRPAPYFAMELIDGKPIDRHAATADLSPRHRLELVARVCDAVQHAHQKGVIHRDIKPANVLVVPESTSTSHKSGPVTDSIGQPKVLDFGVARFTDGDMHSLQTSTGEIVGTLSFMSPEQLDGRPDELDTRCDVYALGVILYVLMSGRLPHDISGLSLVEAGRRIQEEEPPPLHAIDPSLRGDVSTIARKAMAKERDQRYGTAAELADDIRRFLNDEPIAAHPPSAVYQLRKFARRNRTLVGGIAASFIILLLGVAGTGMGLIWALRTNADLEAANTQLEQTNADLEQVTSFQSAQLADIDVPLMGTKIRSSLLDGVPEERRVDLDRALASLNFTDVAMDVLNENIFDSTIASIEEQFREQPIIRARLLQSISKTLRALGIIDRSRETQILALEIYRKELGPTEESTLATISQTGAVLLEAGDVKGAAAHFEEAVRGAMEKYGPEDERTLRARSSLATTMSRLGDTEGALRLQKEVLDIRRKTLGDDHLDTLQSMGNYASVLRDLNRPEEAEVYLREVLEKRRAALGEDDPDTLSTMNTLATLLESTNRFDEAIELHRETLEASKRTRGSDHPGTLRSMNNLAYTLDTAGRIEEALPLYKASYEGNRRVLGEDHLSTLMAMGNYGYALRVRGRMDEAEPMYRGALEGLRRRYGDRHPQTLTAIGNMAIFLMEADRADEAMVYYRASLDGRRELFGAEHPATLNATYNMGNTLWRQGWPDEAEPYCIEALEGYRRVMGEDSIGAMYSLMNLGGLRETQGRFEEAVVLYREAVERRRRVLSDAHSDVGVSLQSLMGMLSMLEAYDELETVARDALVAAREIEDESGAFREYVSLLRLGEALVGLARFSEAEEVLLDARAAAARELEEDAEGIALVRSLLGVTLAGLGRCDEARPLLKSSAERLAEVLTEQTPVNQRIIERAEARAALCP